jgi:hypothetical protein
LTLPFDQIQSMVAQMAAESKAFKYELLKLCWFMRGGVTISEIYHMTLDDRKIMADIIKENMEVTKESGMPFF